MNASGGERLLLSPVFGRDRDGKEAATFPPTKVSAHERRALLRVVDDYLTYCFALETPPRVDELALLLGMSAPRLSYLFKALVGERPSLYLKCLQIEHAKELLLSTNLQMNAVGYASCFGTRTTFFRAFRKYTRTTPEQYRATYSKVQF